MKIIYLKFLSKYKLYDAGQKIIFSDSEGEELDNSLNCSVLVGRNGSGKTTLMSFIVKIFHNIERYLNKIPADFLLEYEVNIESKRFKVILKHFNKVITIKVPDKKLSAQVVPRINPHKWNMKYINQKELYIKYDDIKSFLPNSIVTSTFSMHGEYPANRPKTYVGEQLLCDQSISNIYGKNHYQLGSITKGLYRFIKLILSKEEELIKLLNLFELHFSFRVLVYEYPFENAEWKEVNIAWLSDYEDRKLDDEIHLNDIKFNRYGREITLCNMSSGEKMLLLRSISILNVIDENSLVIIEEPELHLDQVWNRQLFSLFKTLFSKYSPHLLIATHVHSIINSVPKSNLLFLENGEKQKIKNNTFLASYEDLFKSLYGEKFKPNIVEEDYLKSISEKDIETLKTEYSLLGNSVYKYLVFREIKKRES